MGGIAYYTYYCERCGKGYYNESGALNCKCEHKGVGEMKNVSETYLTSDGCLLDLKHILAIVPICLTIRKEYFNNKGVYVDEIENKVEKLRVIYAKAELYTYDSKLIDVWRDYRASKGGC